jgi:quinol-cytochrome oxidoreductase complex cytochrome b subunit
LTWLIGIGLFLLTIGMGFTGYLLPWNQRAYWATTVGTQIAGTVPFVGEFILKALRGGPDLSALTLQRFFSAHIWIIPCRPGRLDRRASLPHHETRRVAFPNQGRLAWH